MKRTMPAAVEALLCTRYYGATMKRTTIMLPPDLKSRAERKARQDGRSFGELVRESLGRYLRSTPGAPSDPLLADEAVFEDAAPADLSSAHDRYLYDEPDA